MNGIKFKGNAPVRLLNTPLHQASFTAPLALAVAVLIAVTGGAGSIALGEPAGHVPGQLLVKPKHGVPEAALQALFAEHGARQSSAIVHINVRVVEVPEGRFDRVLGSLKGNPNIEYAEPNALLAIEGAPNDPYYSLQWHLFKISAPSAW